jgi:alkanesulfonate monooxygenase SsuD/methylene tetrahydromethanopterin reductase-like flavin-dependent oxidoreductase (luciferase family)
MRFGVYTDMQCPPGKPHDQVYWEVQRQIEHADEMGFDTYSSVDHHFVQEFSVSANPLALFCSVAERARSIRFRTTLHVLPPKNPMELAGQIAAADIMTGGRIECGVGRGHAWLYRGFGIPMVESQPRFEEALDILIKAWTNERFSYDGRFWQISNATVVPRPLQKPHPPILMSGTSDNAYAVAGKNGWGVMAPPVFPPFALDRWVGIYKEACATHGHEPEIIYPRLCFLGNDSAQIHRECERPLLQFFQGGLKGIQWISSTKEELQRANYGFYCSGVYEHLSSMSYEDLIKDGIVFAGPPDKLIEEIAWLSDKGITEFDILANYGGMEHLLALKQQELFAAKVMPFFAKGKEGARSGEHSDGRPSL